MPPPRARQKAGETDIFELDGTDICTLGLHAASRITGFWKIHAVTELGQGGVQPLGGFRVSNSAIWVCPPSPATSAGA